MAALPYPKRRSPFYSGLSRYPDRLPWLRSIREAMRQWDAQGGNVVLACSALKRSYRKLLQINPNVKLVYLKGSYELFLERLRSRKGHYAGEQILAGQFADLEEPTDAVTIDAAQSPEEMVAEIRERLTLSEDAPPLAGAEF